MESESKPMYALEISSSSDDSCSTLKLNKMKEELLKSFKFEPQQENKTVELEDVDNSMDLSNIDDDDTINSFDR